MKTNLKLRAGILGGGQLAWMLNLSAQKFGIQTRVWDTSFGASGFRAATEIHCSPWDSEKGAQGFCRDLDFCTLEWESVPESLLQKIIETGTLLMPTALAVKSASSRILERELFASLGFDVAPMLFVKSPEELTDEVWNSFWNSLNADHIFLKHDRGGYDGKGQICLPRGTDSATARDFFALGDERGIIESRADLDFEVSVIAARSRSGKIAVLGIFENHHEGGVLRVSRLASKDQVNHVQILAMINSLLQSTDYIGVAALELFIEKSGKILANEWAPRVHNSGHLSLDLFEESQFDLHWRALADLDFIPNPQKREGLMVNVLGEDLTDQPSFSRKCLLEAADPLPFLARHLKPDELRRVKRVIPYDYGKKEARPGRKMGHLNVLF
jgi:5-(carboxyamino)imidazole ribonucleotide synthase